MPGIRLRERNFHLGGKKTGLQTVFPIEKAAHSESPETGKEEKMMNPRKVGRLVILAVALASLSGFLVVDKAHAEVFVHGYMRSNGTYVSPYSRTNPDGNPYNNYSYGR
jgi:hypothetical protein